MPLQYTLFLMDADGTLFDFVKAEKTALTKALTEHGLPCSDEIIRLYHNINDSLWLALERGEITKPQIVERRFRQLFAALDIAGIEPDAFNARYLTYLGQGVDLIDGAYEVCKQLSERAELAIVTNGVAQVQYSRIRSSKISEFIGEIFVSEEIGCAKPDPRYFAHVLHKLNHADKTDILLVGDSLVADINGGLQIGVDTCWMNPGRYRNESPYIPKYEITRLSQLLDFIYS